ncbi:MAG: protein kinase [Actinomycetota bacterium]|nr:protein kinase [Actinomycetota bacterium]
MTSGPQTPAYLAAGTLIAGRYQLVERIAGGGMGDVWRAVDDVLGRTVALKFLRAEYADDDQFRERLRREARAAGAISHPGVVPVFDFGDIARTDAPHLSFLVMEFVDGPSLSAELQQSGRLDVDRTLLVLEQTAAALQAAHDVGVVHRDIKPGNILVTPAGDVKISDFGIARASDSTPLTRTGTFTGTAKYMSPEQASGQRATEGSDIYALGIVAYACLTGETPFSEGNELSIALAQLQQAPPELPSTVPGGLRELVMGMLEKDPADRPASAGAVAVAARTLRHSGGESAQHPFEGNAHPDDSSPTRVFGGPVALPGADATRVDNPHTAAVPARDRKSLILGAVIVATVLVIGLAVAALQGRGATVPSMVGTQQASAEKLLKAEGLVPEVKTVNAAGKKAGLVLDQSAGPDSEVDGGSAVTLTVASGRVALPAGAILGSTYQEAEAALKALGLNAKQSTEISSRAPGTVIALNPDTVATNGSTVELTVAVAPPVVNDNDDDNANDRKKRRSGKDEDED